MTKTDIQIRKPYFTFDVWQCTNCGYVVSDTQYKAAAFNFECQCGGLWSSYRFVGARLESENEDVTQH